MKELISLSARARVLVVATAFALAPFSILADEPPAGALLDPVVAEVVAMLENGVPVEIVFEWLNGTSRRPGELSGEDLIALNGAGATEALLRRFLELAGEAEPETPGIAPEGAPAPETSTSGQVEEAVEPPTAEPALVMRSPVDVFFTLNYWPKWKQDEQRWDLFVYLDGDILGRVPANEERSLVVLRQLDTGWHRLVVAQERHERHAGPNPTWSHAVRVSPVPIDFNLPAGKNLEVQVVFRRFRKKKKERGPLHLKILQGAKQLERQEQVGAPTSQWLPLCEDLPGSEALAPGMDCIEWRELWGKYSDLDLEAVRLELARFEFAPPPVL